MSRKASGKKQRPQIKTKQPARASDQRQGITDLCPWSRVIFLVPDHQPI